MDPRATSKRGQAKVWSGEAGFSLVSALIALGLISLIVYFVSQSFITSKRAKQSLKASENYQQVQAVLQDSLKNFVKTKIQQSSAPCAALNTAFAGHAFLRYSTASRDAVVGAVPAGVSAAAWDELKNNALTASSLGGAALDRCPKPSAGTGGRFYFCLKVQRDTGASKGSVLEAPLSFAEVSIQLMDLQSGQKLSCSQYLDPNRNSAGASIDYALYWVNELGERVELKHNTGTLYVNK